MANRVVVGPLPGGGVGLRVARPGYNVLDAGIAPRGIAFDSGWARTLKVFASGTVSVPVATGFPQYTAVSFGTTFAAPPVCLAWITNPTGDFAVSGQVKFLDQSVVGFSTGWTDEAIYAGCKISTTQIEFLRFFQNTEVGPYTARYIILSGV